MRMRRPVSCRSAAMADASHSPPPRRTCRLPRRRPARQTSTSAISTTKRRRLSQPTQTEHSRTRLPRREWSRPDGRTAILSSPASDDLFDRALPPEVKAGYAVRADPFDPVAAEAPSRWSFRTSRRRAISRSPSAVRNGAAGGFTPASDHFELSTQAGTTGETVVCVSDVRRNCRRQRAPADAFRWRDLGRYHDPLGCDRVVRLRPGGVARHVRARDSPAGFRSEPTHANKGAGTRTRRRPA